MIVSSVKMNKKTIWKETTDRSKDALGEDMQQLQVNKIILSPG